MIFKIPPEKEKRYVAIDMGTKGILWINNIEISISAHLIPGPVKKRPFVFKEWPARKVSSHGQTIAPTFTEKISQPFVYIRKPPPQAGDPIRIRVENWMEK